MLTSSVVSPSLRAADLVHQISLQTPDATQDAAGQPLNTWPVYLTTRAKVENLSGQQLFQTGQFSSDAIWRVTLRAPGSEATINVGDRVIFATHTFVIQIINNLLERGRVVQLTCIEIDGTS